MQDNKSVAFGVNGVRVVQDAEAACIEQVEFQARQNVYRIIQPCRDRRVGSLVFEQVLEEVLNE